MKFELKTTGEMAQTLAKRLKNLRLLRKWKRSTLAERSGVSEASLRRFEQTARVSLENFLKLLSALDRLDEMDELLQPPPVKSIDDLEARKQKLPKRGSI
ncbi:MAG: helix-turn-helix transcriptional regulator [Deltaproteobacteria bacterium]|nr:helix-turn-helix transcriptional regulator [Deltaproteobacteria bacterium]